MMTSVRHIAGAALLTGAMVLGSLGIASANYATVNTGAHLTAQVVAMPNVVAPNKITKSWVSQDKTHGKPATTIHDSLMFMLQIFIPGATVKSVWADIILNKQDVTGGGQPVACPSNTCTKGKAYGIQWTWKSPLGSKFYGASMALVNDKTGKTGASIAKFKFAK